VTLSARAWLAFVVLVLVMGALLFGPAGTTRYWQECVCIAIYVAASIPMWYLVHKDAALLARRMRGGPMFEKKRTQRFAS
jgi:hypothetical protein